MKPEKSIKVKSHNFCLSRLIVLYSLSINIPPCTVLYCTDVINSIPYILVFHTRIPDSRSRIQARARQGQVHQGIIYIVLPYHTTILIYIYNTTMYTMRMSEYTLTYPYIHIHY